MKILFQNRDPKGWIGGDQIQLEKTREALEKLDIETDFSFGLDEKIDADIVHCFNFSMQWSKYQIWNVSQQNKAIVCSMIYHETDEFVDYKTQQAMINELDACIFLTEGEIERARRHLEIPDKKIYIIENGIDKWWFEPCIAPYPIDVLTVGRIDANKGQLAVAKICKKLGLSYCCIGESSPYAELVKEQGAEVLEPMDQKVLKLHYASCKVYVCPSYKEIMPLTIMEAGSQGRPIVLTKGCEWQIPCERASYNDEAEIELAILKSLEKPPQEAFKAILKDMSWDNVAKQLKSVYESI